VRRVRKGDAAEPANNSVAPPPALSLPRRRFVLYRHPRSSAVSHGKPVVRRRRNTFAVYPRFDMTPETHSDPASRHARHSLRRTFPHLTRAAHADRSHIMPFVRSERVRTIRNRPARPGCVFRNRQRRQARFPRGSANDDVESAAVQPMFWIGIVPALIREVAQLARHNLPLAGHGSHSSRCCAFSFAVGLTIVRGPVRILSAISSRSEYCRLRRCSRRRAPIADIVALANSCAGTGEQPYLGISNSNLHIASGGPRQGAVRHRHRLQPLRRPWHDPLSLCVTRLRNLARFGIGCTASHRRLALSSQLYGEWRELVVPPSEPPRSRSCRQLSRSHGLHPGQNRAIVSGRAAIGWGLLARTATSASEPLAGSLAAHPGRVTAPLGRSVFCIAVGLPLLAAAIPLAHARALDSFYSLGALGSVAAHFVLPLLQASVCPAVG